MLSRYRTPKVRSQEFIDRVVVGVIIIIAALTFFLMPAKASNVRMVTIEQSVFETIRDDLGFFRDFHDSLLVLCERKLEDSLCPPKPNSKPIQKTETVK